MNNAARAEAIVTAQAAREARAAAGPWSYGPMCGRCYHPPEECRCGVVGHLTNGWTGDFRRQPA